MGQLTREQRILLENVIRALFRLPQAEYTIIGLQGLLGLNRNVIKQVYMEMDDRQINAFIERNKYSLGLDSSDTPGKSNEWFRIWEK